MEKVKEENKKKCILNLAKESFKKNTNDKTFNQDNYDHLKEVINSSCNLNDNCTCKNAKEHWKDVSNVIKATSKLKRGLKLSEEKEEEEDERKRSNEQAHLDAERAEAAARRAEGFAANAHTDAAAAGGSSKTATSAATASGVSAAAAAASVGTATAASAAAGVSAAAAAASQQAATASAGTAHTDAGAAVAASVAAGRSAAEAAASVGTATAASAAAVAASTAAGGSAAAAGRSATAAHDDAIALAAALAQIRALLGGQTLQAYIDQKITEGITNMNSQTFITLIDNMMSRPEISAKIKDVINTNITQIINRHYEDGTSVTLNSFYDNFDTNYYPKDKIKHLWDIHCKHKRVEDAECVGHCPGVPRVPLRSGIPLFSSVRALGSRGNYGSTEKTATAARGVGPEHRADPPHIEYKFQGGSIDSLLSDYLENFE